MNRVGELAAEFAAASALAATLFAITAPVSGVESSLDSCAAPSATAIEAVDTLFSNPPLDQTGPYKHEPADTSVAQIASLYGVTLPTHALDVRDTLTNSDISLSAQLSAANFILKQYGVEMTVAQPNELSPGNTNVPTETELKAATTGLEIETIIDGFADVPVQLVRFSGLRDIVLAANTGDAAYAETGGNHSVVAMDISNPDTEAAVIDHEDTHLLDAAECGTTEAAANDPNFTALNGSVDIYAPSAHAHELTNDELSVLEDDALMAFEHGKHAEACHDQALIRAEGPEVVANSDYALTNVVEDKAETGMEIFDPADYFDSLSPETPIVDKKIKYLMARLYDWQPNVVKFLAAIGTRPTGPFPNIKCDSLAR